MSGADSKAGIAELEALVKKLPEELLRKATTHRSWVEEGNEAYGRLAFLGDSVLNIAVSTLIFPRYESYSAGSLTKLRAQAVSRQSCSRVAVTLGVSEMILDEAPDELSGTAGGLAENDRILASVVEAIIGACYLTFGFEVASAAVVAAFEEEIEYADENVLDFKSSLQELLARNGEEVVYRVVEQSGPPHDREFKSVAKVGEKVLGEGSGKSKKESEQRAAKAALDGRQQGSNLTAGG